MFSCRYFTPRHNVVLQDQVPTGKLRSINRNFLSLLCLFVVPNSKISLTLFVVPDQASYTHDFSAGCFGGYGWCGSGAADLDGLWPIIRDGRSQAVPVPEARWNCDAYDGVADIRPDRVRGPNAFIRFCATAPGGWTQSAWGCFGSCSATHYS